MAVYCAAIASCAPSTSPEPPCGSPSRLRPHRIVPAPPPGHRRGADRCRDGASPSMELLFAMAVDGAAIASRAPPCPPNVPTGPRRDCDPAESSPRRRRGTAGAPIDAAMAHRPTLPRSAAPRGDGGRASERGRARTSRDVSRGFPSIRSPTGGPGEVDARDDELRAGHGDTGFSSGISVRANEPIAGRYLGSSHTCSAWIWGHVWPEPC